MTEPHDPRDLVLSLTVAAPRQNIWRCWTEADLLKQWFTPRPWTVAAADLDLRPGGRCDITMRSPEGEEMPNRGVFLEIAAPERLVMTDAYLEGWVPAEKPSFMTAIVTLTDNGDGTTAYHAVARHWRPEDRDAHAAMGFDSGWTQAARQLEALAQSL